MSIISLNTVRSTVGLPQTVEERKLQPFYHSAERTLHRILGDTLFTRINAAAQVPGADVPADELIAELISPFLAWFTYNRALPVLFAEPDRNGIHYKADANMVQSDTSHLKALMKVAADMHQMYQGDIIALMENESGPGQEWEDYRTDTGSVNDKDRHDARKTYAGIVTKVSKWQRPPDRRNWPGRNYMGEQ